MTRETAKKNLELITAFANGETIQHLVFPDLWADLDDPIFYSHIQYRVKPKRVFALYNEMTKDIDYLSENERNFIVPCGWIKVELIKFDK